MRKVVTQKIMYFIMEIIELIIPLLPSSQVRYYGQCAIIMNELQHELVR